jgi:hypothetical protein
MKTASTKTRKRPAPKQDPKLIARIKESLDPKRTYRAIRPFDLRNLGYSLDVSAKTCVTSLQELRKVLETDTAREAGFSYLLDVRANVGYVLPLQYSHYVESGEEANGE